METERGQTLMEFALIMPLLFFMIGAVFLAGLATWRQSAADFGVFTVGVNMGVYDEPVSARRTVYWRDIGNNIVVIHRPTDRQVVSAVSMRKKVSSWLFGLEIEEAVSGRVVVRRWRFYPGPPRGRWE